MAISLAEYNAWLKNTDVRRVLLAEITGYTGGVNETFYFSNNAFQTKPTDSIANTLFLPYLVGSPSFTRSIPFFESGRGEDDAGNIEIDNSDGAFDYFQSYQWRGRTIRLLLGDTSWDYDDFNIKPLLEGTIDSKPNFNDNSIEFEIRDKLGVLDGPVQNNLLGTGGDNQDNPAPLCYGAIQNIEPVLIDNSLHKFKWHDGIVDSIATMYDKGIIITGFTADNPNGEFTLTARPAGTITLDGLGAKPSGTHLKKVADIAEDIIVRIGPLSSGDIDSTAFTQLNTDKPYTIGYFIPDRQNRLDVLDALFASIGGFYVVNYEGKITCGYIKEPSGETPIDSFDGTEIELDGFSVIPTNYIQWRTRLNYGKNWRVQKDGDLAGVITDPGYPNAARVDFLRNEWRTEKYENSGIVPGGTDYELVNDPDAVVTYIDSQADALTEATYRQGILEGQRYLCKFTAHAGPFGLLPGDIIDITDPLNRFSLGTTTNMQILKITYLLLENKAEIEAWY